MKHSTHDGFHWNVSLPSCLVLFLLPLHGQPFDIHRLSLHNIILLRLKLPFLSAFYACG
jgi:hypothetical protein